MSKRFVDPALSGPWCLVFLISLIWQLSVPAYAQTQPQNPLDRKNVLVLYGEDQAHPAQELTDQGIRSAFRSNTLFDVQLYNEYLDVSRFGGFSQARAMTDYLRRRYSGMKIHAIIAIYPHAVDFLLAERRTLFPESPIIATIITRSYAENLERSPARRFVTGTIVGDNITGVVDAALRLRPETKRVALIAGTTPNDAYNEEIFRRGFRAYAGKIDLIDLTKLSMGETLSRVGSLPPDTLVFYASIFRDGAGQSFVPRKALSLVARAATVPVFSLYNIYLGFGIVGGRLVSLEEQGKEAAALALRIMGGESPASIPFGGEQAYVSAYDWRQLRRWNLSVDALPKGSIVINREFTLWDFRYYIIGIVAFFLAETALIVFLIVQRRRRKVAEEFQRKAEDKYRNIFEGSLEGIFKTSPQGQVLTANPALARMLGYDGADDFISSITDAANQIWVNPDDRAYYVRLLEKQNAVLGLECQFWRKDRTEIWVSLNARRVCGPDGKTLFYSGFIEDITERKRTEEALQNSEEKFRQFFKNTPDYCYIISTEGNILHINEAALKTLGYKREELVGQPLARIYAPESLAKMEGLFTQWKESGEIRDEEMVIVTRKGERRIVILNAGAVKDKDGTILHSTSVQTDITERKQMEKTIKKDAEEWQTTFNSIRDLVMILDQEFKIARVNAATVSFFKLPLESILGNHCFTLMHGTSEPLEICPLAKMMKTKTHEETELYDERRDAWFNASVDPIFNDKGETINIIHVVKDITERKRAEAEVAHARTELLRVERSSRLSELTASLAHELNQPLAAILSNAQAALRFLKSDKPDLNEFQEIMRDIISDDQRAGNVIRSLRSMMKREEGEKRPTILNDILNDVIQIFRSEAIFRNVSIETELDGSLPPVFGDKGQLQQVVLNIVMNGAEAMSRNPPEQRKLILRTQRKDHSIWVTVRDFGPGIDKENLERVFQPFFTTKGTGFGMGLAVCSSIIKDHRGRIWVENNPDGGATFFIELPIDRSGK
jgi:PAS domain S-box-containing protein